jgi:EAL domain-containing protein (putative c-di-GMP-specific phosphodiesterase class I)
VSDSGEAPPRDQSATAGRLIDAGSKGARGERLRAALAAIDAVIRYQPQVDLHTGRVAGVEALTFLRGAFDDRSSTTLVGQLEAAGLGLALAEQRLQDICAERRIWRRQIGDDYPIGMPVSQLTLEDPGFLPLVWSTLAAYELPARLLELEIPESVLDGGAASTRALAEATEAGVLIAIDRFNGERSNLRALARFPISKVRVDFALARELEDGSRMAKLFDGIVGAARGIGIVVCATGIDSPELVTAAEYRGCRLAQGVALGLPSDGEQFLALVRGSGVDTASLPVLRIDEGQWQESDAAVA